MFIHSKLFLTFVAVTSFLLSASSSSLVAGAETRTTPLSGSTTLVFQLPSSIPTNPIPSQSYARLYSPDGALLCLDKPYDDTRTSQHGTRNRRRLLTPLTVRNTFELEIPSCAFSDLPTLFSQSGAQQADHDGSDSSAPSPSQAEEGAGQLVQRSSSSYSPSLLRSFLVSIDTRDVAFPQLRVDVHAGADGNPYFKVRNMVPGNAWNEPGPEISTEKMAGRNAVLVPLSNGATKEYYITKQGFVLLSFLKNPMVLMGLVTLFMAVGVPRLMDLIDPETKAEFEQFQKEYKAGKHKSSGAGAGAGAGANSAPALPNIDLAGWLAGKAAPEESPAAPVKEKKTPVGSEHVSQRGKGGGSRK